MPTFRKKPVVIEAVQWTGNNFVEVDEFITVPHETYPKDGYVNIPTLEGVMRAEIGDWIIKGVSGEFYPCKPDIFEQTYEGPVNILDEKPQADQVLEKGKMTFLNVTTDEKVTIGIELLEKERIAVEVDFDPGMRDGNYEGVVANCALVVLNYLKEDGEVEA